jgi:hypothetical protein
VRRPLRRGSSEAARHSGARRRRRDARRRRGSSFFFRGLHIIGGCRDSLAFKPLLRFLRRPPQEVEELLGAATTETLPNILTSVFDGDGAALFDAIVDVKIDDAVRDSFFRAATFLAWEGRIPRQFFVEFLERFYSERLAPDGDMAWFGWMNAIALLGLRDMRPMVLAAHETRTLADLFWEPEFFEGDLAAAERAPNDIERFKQAHLGHIDDIVSSLNRFDTGDDKHLQSPAFVGRPLEPDNLPVINSLRKIGRNDPCPCGSGKKAKRCCLEA